MGARPIRILLLHHDLKPWREKVWCVADLNDEYIDKMEGVLETYERPYDAEQLAVCLDEKPSRCTPTSVRPRQLSRGEKQDKDSEYERCGTANVFCAQ